MKQRTLETIKDIIIIERNHWIFLPVMLTITSFLQGFAGEESHAFLLWAAWGLFPVGFYLLRMKIHRLIPFCLTHIGLAAVVFLLPTGTVAARVMGAGIIFFYSFRSFFLCLQEKPAPGSIHPAVAVGISVFCTYLQHYLGIRHWDTAQLMVLTGGMVLFLILYYMEHYLEFLSFNESSAEYLPATEMFRSGMGLVLTYTMAGAFLLLLSTNVAWLETILNTLKRLLLSVLRFLFSLIPEAKPQEVIPQAEEALPKEPGGMEELFPQAGESSLFWKILEVVVILALACGLLYLGLRLCIWLVRFIRSRFAAIPFRGEPQYDTIPDQREKCCPVRKKTSSRQNPWKFLSPGERIRRRYRKKLISQVDVLSPGDISGLGLLTPRESGDKLGAMDMAIIYEKVRYTKEPVTEGMVRDMRRASQ